MKRILLAIIALCFAHTAYAASQLQMGIDRSTNPPAVCLYFTSVSCLPFSTMSDAGAFSLIAGTTIPTPNLVNPSVVDWLNINSNGPNNSLYFAGLFPNAGQYINLNGLANGAVLVPPAFPVGDPTKPMVAFVASVVNNAGHGTATDNINHYRGAALFQATAYANAASSTGVDIQNNFDVTAPTDVPFIGLEVDMASGRSADCVQGPIYCTGIIVTAAPANPNPAFSLMHGYLLEGASATAWHQGYVIDSGVKDIGFLDESQSTTAFEAASTHTSGFLDASHSTNGFVVSGTASSHTTGFFVAPGSTTGAQFASNNFQVDASGNINISTAAITAGVVVAANRLNLPFSTPATSTATCSVGQTSVDASFIYTCVATNTWHRLANGATW